MAERPPVLKWLPYPPRRIFDFFCPPRRIYASLRGYGPSKNGVGDGVGDGVEMVDITNTGASLEMLRENGDISNLFKIIMR